MSHANRKKAEGYRFNGYPHLDAHSIYSVEIRDLESQIKTFTNKLADPNDNDDKRWVERWLVRYKLELAKKLKGLELKERERS
jgi:hypothetical protein